MYRATRSTVRPPALATSTVKLYLPSTLVIAPTPRVGMPTLAPPRGLPSEVTEPENTATCASAVTANNATAETPPATLSSRRIRTRSLSIDNLRSGMGVSSSYICETRECDEDFWRAGDVRDNLLDNR